MKSIERRIAEVTAGHDDAAVVNVTVGMLRQILGALEGAKAMAQAANDVSTACLQIAAPRSIAA